MESTSGITPREWGVLHLILDQPQSQQVIADTLRTDRAAMVHIADRLEKRNFLKRTPNPDDRRQHLLKITPKGLAAYRSGMKAVTAMQDELLARLKPDERKTLQDFLLRILER